MCPIRTLIRLGLLIAKVRLEFTYKVAELSETSADISCVLTIVKWHNLDVCVNARNSD